MVVTGTLGGGVDPKYVSKLRRLLDFISSTISVAYFERQFRSLRTQKICHENLSNQNQCKNATKNGCCRFQLVPLVPRVSGKYCPSISFGQEAFSGMTGWWDGGSEHVSKRSSFGI